MGLINPDRSFVDKLNRIDPKLGCHFSNDAELFIVTYRRATGKPVPIYAVRCEDGSFRHPDQRDIDAIRQGDMENSSVKEHMAKVSKYMEDERNKVRKNSRDDIRHMTRDGKIQLARAFERLLGGGKYDPFRKVIHKSKGKIFPAFT